MSDRFNTTDLDSSSLDRFEGGIPWGSREFHEPISGGWSCSSSVAHTLSSKRTLKLDQGLAFQNWDFQTDIEHQNITSSRQTLTSDADREHSFEAIELASTANSCRYAMR